VYLHTRLACARSNRTLSQTTRWVSFSPSLRCLHLIVQMPAKMSIARKNITTFYHGISVNVSLSSTSSTIGAKRNDKWIVIYTKNGCIGGKNSFRGWGPKPARRPCEPSSPTVATSAKADNLLDPQIVQVQYCLLREFVKRPQSDIPIFEFKQN